MGIDINGAKFLFYAQKHGVSFAETAMVGRQVFLIESKQLAAISSLFRREMSAKKGEHILNESGGYIEPFLKSLGAEHIDSFDASDYEGATVVHDFNQPIPEIYKEKYSTVLDGGTLEHVFHFPTAIKSCMEMVKPGGHFLGIAPANNYFGHGFYQFSPEIFYRIFSADNGFEIEKMFVFEDADWYEVIDPDVVKERVTLTNDQPTLLLVIARRITNVEIFAKIPQQSDYVEAWGKGQKSLAEAKRRSLAFRAWSRLQNRINRSLGTLANRSKHFRKIDPTR